MGYGNTFKVTLPIILLRLETTNQPRHRQTTWTIRRLDSSRGNILTTFSKESATGVCGLKRRSQDSSGYSVWRRKGYDRMIWMGGGFNVKDKKSDRYKIRPNKFMSSNSSEKAKLDEISWNLMKPDWSNCSTSGELGDQEWNETTDDGRTLGINSSLRILLNKCTSKKKIREWKK